MVGWFQVAPDGTFITPRPVVTGQQADLETAYRAYHSRRLTGELIVPANHSEHLLVLFERGSDRPAALVRWFLGIPGAELLYLPTATHTGLFEVPDALNGGVIDFLARNALITAQLLGLDAFE